MRAHRGLFLAIAIALGACDGATESADNGTLKVVVATSGATPDADGYVVTLADGASSALGANAEWLAGELAPGSYALQLTGIATNCSVAGDNPRTVVVESGQLLTATFVVACTASVRIHTETTGPDPDASGFVVTIGAGIPARVPTSGSVDVQSAANGTLPLRVADVAANCVPDPGNPTVIAVVEAITDITLRFSCVTATGEVEISLSTQSWSGECDNLTVSLDEQRLPLVAYTATRFEDVLPGSHVVSITLPEYCWVRDSTIVVTVSPLEATSVGFFVYGVF